MNVALISNEYPPFNNVGGIATFMAGLANLLVTLGHNVIVFTDGKESLHREVTINGITIIPFSNRKNSVFIRAAVTFFPVKVFIMFLQEHAPEAAKLLRYNLLAFLTFINYKKRASVRVIHAPVLFAPVYLISLIYPSITIVTHAQGPDELLQPYNSVSWDSKLKVRIETSFMKRSDYIIPCSQTINKYLQGKYRSVRKKIIFIRNFIDTKIFPDYKKSLDTNKLIFIGRMEYRKGPDIVVKAFAELCRQYQNLTLTFIGENPCVWRIGSTYGTFSQFVSSLGLPTTVHQRIRFLPRIDKRFKLVKYLSANRGIALLPSRYEPFGFVFIETMMARCITVASACGGGAEIIDNGINGFTVEPKVKNLVTCVKKIKSLPSQSCTILTYRARQKITTAYDISSVRNAYKALFNRIEKE